MARKKKEPESIPVPAVQGICTCKPGVARFQIFGRWAETCYTCGKTHPIVARWIRATAAAVEAGRMPLAHPFTWAVTRDDGHPVWSLVDQKRYNASARRKRYIVK